jgi:23S rRNA pseudouridine2457 synthase
MATVILFNKPFQVLSQFSDRSDHPRASAAASTGGALPAARATLANYLQAPGFRVAGRLDFDSEGLLLLTDSGALQQQITHPRHKLWKTYQVQVEGIPDPEQIAALQAGVTLRDGPTLPARVRRIDAPAQLWPRSPPVRSRLTVSDSWLEISIREGRNRQVRRMTAAVGLPTLRLIRTQIGDWSLEGLAPGAQRRLTVHAAQQRPSGSVRRQRDAAARRKP